ncbi:MAG: PHP domain-containing protein [Candidatus Thorarchaeota archaeon]
MTPEKYDLHIHSDYSDGHGSISEIVARAVSLRLDTIAIADHFWPSVGSRRKGFGVIDTRRREIEVMRLAFPSIRILDAAEVDIESNGNLVSVAGGLEQFDLVIGSVHHSSGSRMWASTIEKVLRNYSFDILGHWDGYLTSYSKEDAERVASILAEKKVAVELNLRYETEHEDFFAIAKEQGCMFTLGSDSHSVKTIGQLDRQIKIARSLGLPLLELR